MDLAKQDIRKLEQQVDEWEKNGLQLESKIQLYYLRLSEKYEERLRQLDKVVEENKKMKEEKEKMNEDLKILAVELDKRKDEIHDLLQRDLKLQMEMDNLKNSHAKERKEFQRSAASTIVRGAIEDCEHYFLRGSTITPSVMYLINDLMNSEHFNRNALRRIKTKFANKTVEKVLEILVEREIGLFMMDKTKRRFGKHHLNFLYVILFCRGQYADDLRRALGEPKDPSDEEKVTKYADEVSEFCTSIDLIYEKTSGGIHHPRNHMTNQEVVEILRELNIVPRYTLRAVEQLFAVLWDE